MFYNLDELITSLLCFLHYIIDQFRNTCDRCPARVTGLLPLVLTLREGIFEVLCIMTLAWKNRFKSAFKV